jgi:hypothetical protein
MFNQMFYSVFTQLQYISSLATCFGFFTKTSSGIPYLCGGTSSVYTHHGIQSSLYEIIKIVKIYYKMQA